MIKYALICDQSHDFESWFANSASFEEQARRGFVSCPVCNSIKVERAIMAPHVARTDRGKTMIAGKFDFGFAVDWMRKDLGLVLDEARANGARLPVTALVDQFYADVQRMGGNRWDTSSLIKRLQKSPG